MSEIEHIEASLRTDQGRVRGRNEDFVACWEPEDAAGEARHGRLYIIADGVGGADAGDVASRFATERTIHHYLAGGQVADWGQRLLSAIQAANDDLRQMVANRADGTRMATTLVAALIADGQLYLANVGDSRGYHWRDGTLRQITKDQSLVAQLVEEGAITAEEAARHPHRNVILYSLGSERSPRIDLFTMPLAPDDRLLLCSDGLTRYVSNEELTAVLTQTDLDAASSELVNLANDRGGGDNISVVLLEFSGDVLATTAAHPALVTTQAMPAVSPAAQMAGEERSAVAAVPAAAGTRLSPRARRLLWYYTGFLCLVETVAIWLVWLRIQL